MNNIKFMELMYRKCLDILEMDNTFMFNTYVYQGDVVLSANNGYSDVFIYVRPFTDSVEELKKAYKTLSDYRVELFAEKICGIVKQDG